ncbi:MAG: hypothetical protein HYU69_13750 [Bacteroidetes bacterium]|nr:hypothetical protein [Bacteroidota bacterium]
MTRSFRQLILFISIFTYETLHSQELRDKLIKLSGDTIVCRITLINDNNIFFDYNYKKGKIRNEYLSTRELKGYILDTNNKAEILARGILKDTTHGNSQRLIHIDQSFWKPEYIILLNNDTLYGETRITGDWTSVMFKMKGENEERPYTNYNIKEFLESNIEYFFFNEPPKNSRENLASKLGYFGNSYLFWATDISGPLYLLYREIMKDYPNSVPGLSSGSYISKEYTLYVKGNTPAIIDKGEFRDKVSIYFEDYPELALKIKNKIYSYDDIGKIVEEYNRWKLKNK